MELKNSEVASFLGMVFLPVIGLALRAHLPVGIEPVSFALGLGLVWLLVLTVAMYLRPSTYGVTDVTAGPNDPVRAPQAEACLREAGWTPLAVLRVTGSTPHDVMWWASPAANTFAEATVLPTGEHLSLTTLRADGSALITAWAEPLLDTIRRPHRARVPVARDAGIFERHAARLAGESIPPHDRALVFGYERAAVGRLERIERRSIVATVGLLGAFCAAMVWAMGVLAPWELATAAILGLGAVMAVSVGLSRPAATWVMDWGAPTPADRLRTAVPAAGTPGVLAPVDVASVTPVRPPDAQGDEHRVLWTATGVLLVWTLLVVAVRVVIGLV